jgi:hypothetical protein
VFEGSTWKTVAANLIAQFNFICHASLLLKKSNLERPRGMNEYIGIIASSIHEKKMRKIGR